jgi:ankyrin repeat protein
VAKYLIQSGADVNFPGVKLLQYHSWFPASYTVDETIPFQTPVQIATKMNNLDLLQILLQHGALAMACPVSAHPGFHKLCSYQAKSDGPWKYEHRYWRPRTVYTAPKYGVLNQNLNIVGLLLSVGVAPDSRVAPGVGDTPLQMSARLSNFELFRLLLSSGADVNAPPATSNGRTAVQGVAESGNWEILSMLQSAGARINAPAGAKLGMTGLQAACLNGHSLMAGFLLARQANLNAAPSSMAGLTPVQAAAMHGDIGLVSNLISLGAEVDAPATEMANNRSSSCYRESVSAASQDTRATWRKCQSNWGL